MISSNIARPDMHFCYFCITQLWSCTHIKCWSCQTRLLHCSIDRPNLAPPPPQSVVVVDLSTLFGVQYVVPSNVSDYYFCTYLAPLLLILTCLIGLPCVVTYGWIFLSARSSQCVKYIRVLAGFLNINWFSPWVFGSELAD